MWIIFIRGEFSAHMDTFFRQYSLQRTSEDRNYTPSNGKLVGRNESEIWLNDQLFVSNIFRKYQKHFIFIKQCCLQDL